MRISLIAIGFLILSCAGPDPALPAPRAYRQIAWGDILVGGERVHVHLSQASDEGERTLLGSLNPSMPVDSIMLIGVLHDERRVVPETDEAGNALLEAGEAYRYFDLVHWYVLCPYTYDEAADTPDFDELRSVERDRPGPRDLDPAEIDDHIIWVGPGEPPPAPPIPAAGGSAP